MAPPRVVVNGRFLEQPMTGVQRFARNVTSELLRLRDDVEVLAPPAVHDADVPHRTVGRGGGHRWEQVDLPRALRQEGSPLLVGLGNTGPAAYRPQVVTHHDITYVRHPESFSRTFATFYRLLAPRLLRGAEAVVTVSEFSRSEIATHHRVPVERVHVIPNAVATDFGADEPDRVPDPARRPYYLAVSSPAPHKNFARLVAAYARLAADRRPDLLVVGAATGVHRDGTAERDVPGVRFLGRVDDAALRALYAGATAFVFPSLYEGFGIPPLEAQASGAPVLASDIPPVREALGTSALYVDPRDVAAMAAGMARLADDAALRERLVASGRANVARFSWRESAQRLSDLLDHVLDRLPDR